MKLPASLLALALLLTGCGGESEPSADVAPAIKGKIGTTCMDLTNPFFKLIANVMEEEAAKNGYELVALDGAGDAAKQNNQLSDFAAQGYAAVFLNPTDSKAVGVGVKKLHAAGIPVFSFDVQVSDEEAKELVVSHIGSDNYQGGRLAGESLMKATGDRGKVAILSYPEVSSCILRVDGFRDYLEENNSKLEIVTELNGKANRNESFSVTNDILQSHGDLAGVFAINDPSGLGAYAAVAKAELADQVHVVAFDASPAGKQGVFEKKLYDTPQQFPRKMAKGTVDAFVAYQNGEDIEKTIFIPCEHYVYETAVADETREAEQW